MCPYFVWLSSIVCSEFRLIVDSERGILLLNASEEPRGWFLTFPLANTRSWSERIREISNDVEVRMTYLCIEMNQEGR